MDEQRVRSSAALARKESEALLRRSESIASRIKEESSAPMLLLVYQRSRQGRHARARPLPAAAQQRPRLVCCHSSLQQLCCA
jgi:hypothetical protein